MKIDIAQWREICEEYLNDTGISKADIKTLVDVAIMADIRGVASHGTVRLPVYKERLQLGLINKAPNITAENHSRTFIYLNGDNGLGQVAVNYATEMAISKAKKYGSCIISMRNCNHMGMLAYYGIKAAKENLISYIMCNTPPLVVPYGGMEPAIGTNPLCWSVPGPDFPIVMDMAISPARGKIRMALAKGEALPEGWALDKDGIPTTNAKAAMEGSLLPVGGVKGYGIGFIVELLTGVLSGAKYGHNMTHSFDDLKNIPDIGVFIMTLDVEQIMPIGQFKERVADYIKMVKATKKAPGHEEIYVPGERSWLRSKEAEREGLNIDEETFRLITSVNKSRQSPLLNANE